MSIRRFFRSVGFAFRGLRISFQQPNTRIQWSIALLFVSLGAVLNFSPTEWLITALCIGMVTALELMNTALEKVVDLISPDQHPLARDAKDLAAASVLAASITSAIIGSLMLLNHLRLYFWP